jgi:beta-lactamase class A
MNAFATSANSRRRNVLKLAMSSLAAPVVAACGASADAIEAGTVNAEVSSAVGKFAALVPLGTHCKVHADVPGAPWVAQYQADRQLFIGSAVKTFILAQALRDTEVQLNGLTEDAQQPISDAVRSLSSPVLLHLNGTMPLRHVLEAMIAHSDNTATDIAIAAVQPDRVRQLIKQAALSQTQIPDSTRRLFSYLAGAPAGTDLGWDGISEVMRRADRGEPIPGARAPVNPAETMLSTATEMVSWYRQALSGVFFSKPQTLTEFKRIHSMANAISMVVPAGIAAYAKGGSIDWQDSHALSLSGQMIVERTPVTFSFTCNWAGTKPGMEQAAGQAIATVLEASAGAIRNSRR